MTIWDNLIYQLMNGDERSLKLAYLLVRDRSSVTRYFCIDGEARRELGLEEIPMKSLFYLDINKLIDIIQVMDTQYRFVRNIYQSHHSEAYLGKLKETL